MHQSKTFEHCRTMLHELERCKEMIVVTLSEVGRKQFIDNRTEQRWRSAVTRKHEFTFADDQTFEDLVEHNRVRPV